MRYGVMLLVGVLFAGCPTPLAALDSDPPILEEWCLPEEEQRIPTDTVQMCARAINGTDDMLIYGAAAFQLHWREQGH